MGAFLSILLATTPVAVTIDDLPIAGELGPNDTKEAATARILAALKQHKAPVTGFVVCGSAPAEELQRLLARWRAAGAELGNHTMAHRALDSQTLEEWTQDVRGCSEQLKAHSGAAVKFFRFPYLREGKDPATRDAAAAVLKNLGLRSAQVSIDTSDWELARLYTMALKSGDEARAAEIGRDYVAHVRLAVQHYRALGLTMTKREVSQVLLLHANSLAADWLPQLLTALAKDGVSFVGLEQALKDPIYLEPQTYTGKIGLSWLYRIRADAAQQWKWDDAQLEWMALSWKGQTLQISEELAIRALAPRTWLIVHSKPHAANSVLAEMPDGTLVFVGSPYDPGTTRTLLEWILFRLGPRPLVAINTHFHFDGGGGGNAAFAEAGAKVWGSDLTAKLLNERAERLQKGMIEHLEGRPEQQARFREFLPQPPKSVFPLTKGLKLAFGGESVEVKFPGAAHAPDNVVVWFPGRKLLVGGCAVVAMPKMGYLGDADLATWPKALEVMRALKPALVVPGHEQPGDAKLFDHTLELVTGAALIKP